MSDDLPRPTARQRLLRVGKRVVQLGLTVVLFWLATRKVNWADVGAVLARANWVWVVVAFVALNVGQLISAQRFTRMAHFAGIHLPYRLAAWLFYQGMFYNLVLPGGISGDGYKGYDLNRQVKGRLRQLITALVLERGSGALALLVLCCALVAAFPPPATAAVSAPLLRWIGYFAWAVVVAVPVFLVLRLGRTGLWHWVRAVQAVLPLSVSVQLCQLGFALAMALALGVPLGQTPPYLLAFAASSLVAVLPVSIGGIGAREYVLSHANLALAVVPEVGILLAMGYNVLYLISAGLGALPGRPRQSATALGVTPPAASS